MWKEDEPWNNRSVGHVRVYLYSTNQYFVNWIGDAYLDVNGGRAQTKSERFSMSGTNSNIQILEWDGYIGHNSAGEASFYAYAYFNIPNGASYTPRGLWADASIALANYDRSAKTPSYNNITRTSATNVYVTHSYAGSYYGPTTYVLERATNAAMSENYFNFSEGNQTVDANTSYWYRMYAYGDEGGAKYSGVYGPYYGQPTAPSLGTPTRSAIGQKRISVPITPPSYIGSGISSYTITRTGPGSTTKVFTNVTSSPFIDTDADLVPGTSYTYTATASSSAYTSTSSTSSASVIAAGIPYAPTSQPTVSNNGLDVTVVSSAISGNGGVDIVSANANEGYFVQYQLADTLDGTYGYLGVVGAWSPAVKMSDQISRRHTYQLMSPAKFYKFRVYAANTVIYGSNASNPQLYYPHNNNSYTANFATTTTGYFLAAGGKRWDGNEWIPTETAKRYDGDNWIPLTIAKRYDGDIWVPLS